MPQKGKPTTSWNKAKAIRITLVTLTVILFGFFIYTFLFSYNHYQSIHKRIENLHHSINEIRHDYVDVISLYSQAENEFRLFSVDFDQQHYNNYKEALGAVETKIDSMLTLYALSEDLESQYPDYLETHRKLTDDFILLRLKIGELLDHSEELSSISYDNFSHIEVPLPPSLQTSSISSTDSTRTENVLVINKKPFFKRIFNNKADTIQLSEVTILQQERDEIIREFSNELRTTYTTSQDKLNELRRSFSMLRNKEKDLLTNNASLLHQVNNIIYTIRATHINSRQIVTDMEIKKLLEQTSDFKWKMILALTFMMLMIGLIVYYQFFATYFEQKLMNEKSYAAKLAQEKTDTLAEITHEIRTPINSLLGIVDMLRLKEDFSPQDKMLLDSAYSDLSNTSKTINDILNISRIEGLAPKMTDFSVRELVEDIMESYQNQAQNKGIELRHEFGDNLPAYIYSDEFKLRQIMTNLISNAVKYSEKGTITLSLQVKKGKRLHMWVADEGIGMPKEVQDNIFKKYYTASNAKIHNGGIGLGLYITQKLAENLGGKISCDSRDGLGTTFHVDIPFEPSNNIPVRPKHKTNTPAESDIIDTRLLVVDDNPLNLLYMQQLLNEYPHVLTAKNGKDAVHIINTNTIDVVITDINMPVMDGHELLNHIRSSKKINHIKVIATSADNEQVHDSEGNLKFDHTLTKPFDKKMVNKVIRTARFEMENFV